MVPNRDQIKKVREKRERLEAEKKELEEQKAKALAEGLLVEEETKDTNATE